MKTTKDILIVMLLSILVAMTCVQEGDILNLKHRAFMLEGGLVSLYGGLVSLKGGLDSLRCGLDPSKDGLALEHFRAASAILWDHAGHGSGVFVSDNVLLTAKHVVEDRAKLSDIKVVGPNGVVYIAVEILEDADDDLAVVVVEGRQGPWLELGSWPSLGDDVICIGTPFSEQAQLIISWGHVSSTKWKNKFIYDGFCWPGCSGGPVIVNGKLAGIVEARLTGTASLGFAVPLERLDPDLMARIK